MVFHYIRSKNALKALLEKIVWKTLFSQEIRDVYGKTMLYTFFNAEFSNINIVCP